MRLDRLFRTALNALNANKIRSALTMLGVIIGVFAVVTMISIGRGLQNYITDQFNELGSNLLFVVPGNFAEAGFGNDPASFYSRNKLEEKHVDMIKTNLKQYDLKVTPHISIGETARYKTKEYYTTIEAVNYQAEDIFNYVVNKGRFFTKTDEKSKAKVAILGKVVVDELFANSNPVGKKIKLGGDTYEVIGTFKEKGVNYDRGTIIPYTSAKESFEIENVTDISIKAKNSEDLSRLTSEIKRVLIRDMKEEDFSIMSQEQILTSINDILRMLTIGLGAIAAISLIVGGIGIMNIMLVSVTERTREIGLRKAVGATPANISTQFLLESTTLSVSGGVIGLLLGYATTILTRQLLNIRTELPWWSVVLAFGFAALVGIVFGTYPAISAGKKDPIEALRYE